MTPVKFSSLHNKLTLTNFGSAPKDFPPLPTISKKEKEEEEEKLICFSTRREEEKRKEEEEEKRRSREGKRKGERKRGGIREVTSCEHSKNKKNKK
jgi:hypothetical protein